MIQKTKNEESCSLGRLFRSLSTGERSDSIDADIELAKKEAQKLYNVNFFLLYQGLMKFSIKGVYRTCIEKLPLCF